MALPFLPDIGTLVLEQFARACGAVPSFLRSPDRARLRVVAYRADDGLVIPFATSLEIGVDADEGASRVVDADGVYLIDQVSLARTLGEREAFCDYLQGWRRSIPQGGIPGVLQDSVQLSRRPSDSDKGTYPCWRTNIYEPIPGGGNGAPHRKVVSIPDGVSASTIGQAAARWLADPHLEQYQSPRMGTETIIWDRRGRILTTSVGVGEIRATVESSIESQFFCGVTFRNGSADLGTVLEPVVGMTARIKAPHDATDFHLLLLGADNQCYDERHGGLQAPVAQPDRMGRSVKTGPVNLLASDASQYTETQSFLSTERIDALRTSVDARFDFTRLVEICDELNICYREECFIAVAALTRALLDHIPPIFGATSFAEVANNYAGSKSFKKSMQHLENSARNISDGHLHQKIRARETNPNRHQVNFSQDLDVLLAEIGRIVGTS